MGSFNSVLFTKSCCLERLCVPRIVNCGLCGFENIIQGKINIHQVGETLVKCFAPQIKCAHGAVWRIECIGCQKQEKHLELCTNTQLSVCTNTQVCVRALNVSCHCRLNVSCHCRQGQFCLKYGAQLEIYGLIF